jgi:hypothetical protein
VVFKMHKFSGMEDNMPMLLLKYFMVDVIKCKMKQSYYFVIIINNTELTI